MACAVIASACSSGGGSAAKHTTTSKAAPAPGPSTQPTPPTSAPAPIPAQYGALTTTLGAGLDAYQATVDALPSPSTSPASPVHAAELLVANGNRLRALLQPATLAAADRWLDRFAAIGIKGVTLGIKLPMLLPQFGPDGDAYASFYAAVADHARARGLTVDVELGALFCGTVFAQCSYSFHGSYDAFVRATVDQARIVVERVRPDYLTILAEPTTEAALTGVHDFDTPAGSARYVHDVLAGIGPRGSTKVGAGAATWVAPTYNQAILQEPVDYLDLHIYPVNAHIAATIAQDTALARGAGKPIVADEVYLYKVASPTQAAPAASDRTFRLDAFSFFEPLDIRFLDITGEWARKAGVSFVSAYWSSQFFSYLPWTPERDGASYAALSRELNAAVGQAFARNELTDLGRAWARPG